MTRQLIAIVAALAVVLSMLLLSGCHSAADTLAQPHEAPNNASWVAGDSPIPTQRTGLYRQGITTTDNRFDCTAAGVYYLSPEDSYILYCDHNSDTFIPLCSRPDCGHADYEGKFYWTCNAYFCGAISISFYNGYLYVLMDDETDGFCIKRVDPSGSNRVTVWKAERELLENNMLSSPTLWNGVLTYTLVSFDENGNLTEQTYYYLLDGSMKEPLPAGMSYPRGNHGDAFITTSIGVWNPDTATEQFLTEFISIGYYGTEAAYLILDGVISRVNYATGDMEALLDTGLDGTYDLHCFPDCLVVKETLPYEQLSAGQQLQAQHLYFYNWAFENIGSIEVENNGVWPGSIICGETAYRIYLALDHQGIPSHYIDKEDFGTGNIALHQVNLPSLPLLETGETPPRDLSNVGR